MKKLTSLVLVFTLFAVFIPSVNAAPQATVFDFSTMTNADISNNLPTGWGNLNGSRTSEIVSGNFGLNPEVTYLEISNVTNSGAWGAPPVYPATHQFKDYRNVDAGETLHFTVTIAAYDENFYQLGIVSPRANVTYVDAYGTKNSVGDVNFSGNIALAAFEKDSSGNVILTSWGQNVTPENFVFETERFYKLDCVVHGITNTMDLYLDGELLTTVDYTNKFTDMTTGSVTYDFTQYSTYYVSQFKRIGIVQYKPKTYSAPFTAGIAYAGVTWYGASDEVPEISFMPDDFEAKGDSTLVSSVDKEKNIVMFNEQALVSEVKAEFSGDGLFEIYKDHDYTEKYSDDEFIEYPAYARYYTTDNFKLFDLQMVSEVYIDNGEILTIKDYETGEMNINFSGNFINLRNQSENAVVVICGYKNGVMQFIHMIDLVDVVSDYSIDESIRTDKEIDRVDAWAIDNINNRSVVSKIIRAQ